MTDLMKLEVKQAQLNDETGELTLTLPTGQNIKVRTVTSSAVPEFVRAQNIVGNIK